MSSFVETRMAGEYVEGGRSLGVDDVGGQQRFPRGREETRVHSKLPLAAKRATEPYVPAHPPVSFHDRGASQASLNDAVMMGRARRMAEANVRSAWSVPSLPPPTPSGVESLPPPPPTPMSTAAPADVTLPADVTMRSVTDLPPRRVAKRKADGWGAERGKKKRDSGGEDDRLLKDFVAARLNTLSGMSDSSGYLSAQEIAEPPKIHRTTTPLTSTPTRGKAPPVKKKTRLPRSAMAIQAAKRALPTEMADGGKVPRADPYPSPRPPATKRGLEDGEDGGSRRTLRTDPYPSPRPPAFKRRLEDGEDGGSRRTLRTDPYPSPRPPAFKRRLSSQPTDRLKRQRTRGKRGREDDDVQPLLPADKRTRYEGWEDVRGGIEAPASGDKRRRNQARDRYEYVGIRSAVPPPPAKAQRYE